MTRSEFMHIIENESLIPEHVGLEKEPGLSHVQDTYGWAYIDGKWCPYETDEKACPMYFEEYDTESEALEDLLKTLKRRKRIEEKGEKMIKDYISKMNPEKLIAVMEEKGDFCCVRDAEGFRTYTYNLWDDVKNVTVPTVNPQLNAWHLAYAAEAIYSERGTPRDFTILRCLNEADILQCIEGIKDEAQKLKEKSDAGEFQDGDVQELFVLCGELMEIRYISLERWFDIAAEKSQERYELVQRIADTVIENHRK